jgi:hypothetical protein
VHGARGVAFAVWKGWEPFQIQTVGELEEKFALVCAYADQALGELAEVFKVSLRVSLLYRFKTAVAEHYRMVYARLLEEIQKEAVLNIDETEVNLQGRKGTDRDIDVLFIGNLHPAVQRERLPWLVRLARLARRWNVQIHQARRSNRHRRQEG